MNPIPTKEIKKRCINTQYNNKIVGQARRLSYVAEINKLFYKEKMYE